MIINLPFRIVLEEFDCLLRSDGDFLTDFLVTCQELQLERRKPDSDGKGCFIPVPDEVCALLYDKGYNYNFGKFCRKFSFEFQCVRFDIILTY